MMKESKKTPCLFKIGIYSFIEQVISQKKYESIISMNSLCRQGFLPPRGNNIAELPLQHISLLPCQCFKKATGNYCVFTLHLVPFYT